MATFDLRVPGVPSPPGKIEVVTSASSERLEEIAQMLFECYAGDPAFAELYGFEGSGQVAVTLPIFRQIVRRVALIHHGLYVCGREGVVVGAMCVMPFLSGSAWRTWLRYPARTLTFVCRNSWLAVRHRGRLPKLARRRWRDYGRLAGSHQDETPRLRVLALGVAPHARRSGVASALLSAAEHDEFWRPLVGALEVNTWTSEKRAIYERMGFEEYAHGKRDGVECWTLRRGLRAAPEETSQ